MTVVVNANARLHLGFFDPDATLGRQFGSLGMSVSDIDVEVEVSFCRKQALQTSGEDAPRADAIARALAEHYGTTPDVSITVDRSIPAHVGLGSGTQLSLALGTALTTLWGIEATTAEIAGVLSRGARSGIGIGLFERGGFVLDGGRGENTTSPPVIGQVAVPEGWRVLLFSDSSRCGLSGDAERAAFKRLPEFGRERAARLCHLGLMGALPALHESDFGAFSYAIGEIQQEIGDHFSAVQKNHFSSPLVGEAVEYCAAEFGYSGRGQSSWGPTGFVFVPNHELAAEAMAATQARFANSPERGDLSVMCARPNNRPADIRVTQALQGERVSG